MKDKERAFEMNNANKGKEEGEELIFTDKLFLSQIGGDCKTQLYNYSFLL